MHVGDLIRKERVKRNLTAETLASMLKKPISKQAFAKKERTGSFSFELVEEISEILKCEMDIFLTRRSTKSGQGDPAA